MKKHQYNRIKNSLWILCDLGLFLFAVVFDTPSAWLPFYFVSFLMIVNGLTIMSSLKYLQVLNQDNVIVEGDMVLGFTNPKRILIPILSGRLQMEGHQDLHASSMILFKSEFELSFKIDTISRGAYPLVGLDLEMSDFLGMFKRSIFIPLTFDMLVLPKQQDEEAKAFYDYILNQTKVPMSEADFMSFDIKTIRSYQQGDRINLIDWKLSSKKQELMVKEYDFGKENRIQFIFIAEEDERFELMMATFYTFYCAYLEGKQESVFVFSGNMIEVNPSRSSFAHFVPYTSDEDLFLKIDPQAHTFIFTTESTALSDIFASAMVFQIESDHRLVALFDGAVERVSPELMRRRS